jgi:Bacterial Ig domain
MGLSEKSLFHEYAYRDIETHEERQIANMNANMEITEKRLGARVAVRGSLSFLIVTLLAFFWWGCEGPQGPTGMGVEELDVESPNVSLIDGFFVPMKSTTVFADTFTVRAEADDDNGVEYVEFFFDGTSEMGEQTAIDSTSPYLWIWNMDSTGLDFGTYPLMARAYDAAGNSGDTPTVLIYYRSPPELDTLSEYGTSNQRTTLTMPDNFDDQFWNVRVSPAKSCRLLQIHFEFKDPQSETMTGTSSQLVGGADFEVYAWNSDETTRFPVTPALNSKLVLEEEILNSDPDIELWTIVDVSDWNVEFSDKFHVGFSIPDYENMKTQLRAIPIWLNINTNHDDPNDHSSIEYAGNTWGTIQANWGSRWDFRIRAEVVYEDGSHALLHPDGTSEAVQHR